MLILYNRGKWHFHNFIFWQISQHSPTANPEMEQDDSQHVPRSQAQPLLHVASAPPPPPHTHMPDLEDTPPAQHSPTLSNRQEVPMSPESPPPTMGSPPRKQTLTPPPNITVHDITNHATDTIAVVSTPTCHMMDEKPVHMKRRNCDPDGIALGESCRKGICIILMLFCLRLWRCDGLVVSTLEFQSGGW